VASKDKQSKHLTDRQKEEIDAESKQLIRQLEASIRNLTDAESLSQKTEATLIQKKYGRLGLGALGSWAAGGLGQTKSHDQEVEEAKANAIKTHREGVIWYLSQKIQQCSLFQAVMMEKRLRREMEKNKSALAKSRAPLSELGGFDNTPVPPTKRNASAAAHLEKQHMDPEQELSPEQIQMFEKENQDMLKHYESTLDQVRYGGMAYVGGAMLTKSQNGREVVGRDIRATDTTCEQSSHTVGTHRPARGRFLVYSRECWER
jgi:syntaxin 18